MYIASLLLISVHQPKLFGAGIAPQIGKIIIPNACLARGMYQILNGWRFAKYVTLLLQYVICVNWPIKPAIWRDHSPRVDRLQTRNMNTNGKYGAYHGPSRPEGLTFYPTITWTTSSSTKKLSPTISSRLKPTSTKSSRLWGISFYSPVFSTDEACRDRLAVRKGLKIAYIQKIYQALPRRQREHLRRALQREIKMVYQEVHLQNKNSIIMHKDSKYNLNWNISSTSSRSKPIPTEGKMI